MGGGHSICGSNYRVLRNWALNTARIVELQDFIPDVDNISNRVNIDDTQSGHYEEIIDFLLDSKFCVVNGRVTKELVRNNRQSYTAIQSL